MAPFEGFHFLTLSETEMRKCKLYPADSVPAAQSGQLILQLDYGEEMYSWPCAVLFDLFFYRKTHNHEMACLIFIECIYCCLRLYT